jgi:hypothetical protein
MQVTYIRTISNHRDLVVNGDSVTVEDIPPGEGGKPITPEEFALIERVRATKGWTDFCISQKGRFAWTKSGKPDPWRDDFMWLKPITQPE